MLRGRSLVTNLRLPGQYDERLFQQAGLNLQGPYYNQARWYLPGVGRYLEPDPIARTGAFNGLYGPDWYSYGNGNPLRYSDRTGSDIWIEGPSCNGSQCEPMGHRSINVGDPLGDYDSYSFGVNGDPWLGGEVYRDTVHGGDILSDYYIYTSSEEDAAARAYLDGLLGDKAPNRPWRTCRTFSYDQFDNMFRDQVGFMGLPSPEAVKRHRGLGLGDPWIVSTVTDYGGF